MGTGRRPRVIFGVVSALLGGALLAGGGIAWTQGARADRDGFVADAPATYRTATAALTWEGAGVLRDGAAAELVNGGVRIRVASRAADSAIFVGVARPADVEAYLAGIGHDRIASTDGDSRAIVHRGGLAAATRPGSRSFWLARASGPGTQTLRYGFSGGDWTVVVMNADGSPGLAVQADRGVSAPLRRPIVGGLAGGGILLAIGLIFIGSAGRTRPHGTGPRRPGVASAHLTSKGA